MLNIIFLVSPPAPTRSPEWSIAFQLLPGTGLPLQCSSESWALASEACQGQHSLHVPRCMGHPFTAAVHDTQDRAQLPAFSLQISSPCWATWGRIIAFTLSSDIPTFKHLLSHCSPNRKTISATLGVSFTANLLIRETHFRRDSWGPVNMARTKAAFWKSSQYFSPVKYEPWWEYPWVAGQKIEFSGAAQRIRFSYLILLKGSSPVSRNKWGKPKSNEKEN